LRARINEFCELHHQSKFRQAEQMVAGDTKDYFYNAAKPTYVSYQIQSIKYNEDFTKATAMVVCEQYLPAPGFEGKTVKLLTPFHWKIENGQWMWYINKDSLLVTPFGKMTLAPRPGEDSAPPGPASPKVVIPMSIEQFLALVKADKTAVSLKPGASDQVVISNATAGVVTLAILQQVRGVEAKMETSAIPAAGKVSITLHASQEAASGILKVGIRPFGRVISIKVSIE